MANSFDTFQASDGVQTSTQPICLITGGGTGIGRATAERFIQEGWRVLLVGRRLGPLQSVQTLSPQKVQCYTCDITKAQAVTDLVERLEKDGVLGEDGLSALVNNAGIVERRPFAESDDALWTSMFETNLLGAVRITRALLPHLIRGQGGIVNVSSNLGLRPIPDTSAYSAIKAAMINWTQSLAIELGKHKVRANCICPGIVDTPIQDFHFQPPDLKAKTEESLSGLQPLGRIGQPRDIAHGIWSLCAPGSEWTTGSTLTIDGGISLV